MRLFLSNIYMLIGCLIMGIILQCSSSKNASEYNLEKTNPIQFEEPYFQSWIAGIQGGGSGINLYLPSNDTTLKLDSVYFRGMISKVKIINTGYISHFKTNLNQRDDIIMSDEENAEYGNQLPSKDERLPFQLKDNECVISYTEDDITKYFKVINLIEVPIALYPSTAPKD